MNSKAPAMLNVSGELSPRIETLLLEGQWDELSLALEDGLPANLTSWGDVALFERVLVQPEDVRLQTQTHVAPLPMSLLETFIRKGLTRETLYDNGSTAVSLAANYGQWDWVERLLAHGYPVESTLHPHAGVYHAMIEGRTERRLPSLHPHIQVSADQPAPEVVGNVTPFRRKPEAPQSVTPEPHQSLGRRLNVDTPLEEARVRDMIQVLASAGANTELVFPHEEDEGEGPTPLMEAIWVLDPPMVTGLLSCGVDLEQAHVIADMRLRPLELAIHKGARDIAEPLMDAGAPITPNTDRTMSFEGRRQSQPLVFAAAHGQDMLIKTIASRMSPEAIAEQGSHAMQLAASQGHVKAIKMLREVGVLFTVRSDPSGFMPIHQAAAGGHMAVIDFLLHRGQDLEAPSYTGVTAAEVLRRSYPDLAKIYGVSQSSRNVRALLPKAR